MCGIVGVFLPQESPPEAAILAALGLQQLQHRGQDGAGITSYGQLKPGKREKFHTRKTTGLVRDYFTKKRVLRKLRGNVAVGHVRYKTSGSKSTNTYDIQPFYGRFYHFALAHNGHIPSGKKMRKDMIRDEHTTFESTVDSDVIVRKIISSRRTTIEEQLLDALAQIDGAYSLVVLAPNKLIGICDPHGFRPLVLGKRKLGGYVLASETCALKIMKAEFIRHIHPGEMIIIDESGFESRVITSRLPEKTPCVFEEVYFSRPDSILPSGEDCSQVRERLGVELARETASIGITADCVIPIPDSATYSTLGFSRESGMLFEPAIIRNHYIGRTFIAPTEEIRDFELKLKHSPIESRIRGKKIILIDDSIVRGSTIRDLVRMVREYGAKEVHVAIAYPQYKNPCVYGIATPTKNGLLAHQHDHSVESMRKSINADSLHFLSFEGLQRAVKNEESDEWPYCTACVTGKYPIPIVG